MNHVQCTIRRAGVGSIMLDAGPLPHCLLQLRLSLSMHNEPVGMGGKHFALCKGGFPFVNFSFAGLPQWSHESCTMRHVRWVLICSKNSTCRSLRRTRCQLHLRMLSLNAGVQFVYIHDSKRLPLQLRLFPLD